MSKRGKYKCKALAKYPHYRDIVEAVREIKRLRSDAKSPSVQSFGESSSPFDQPAAVPTLEEKRQNRRLLLLKIEHIALLRQMLLIEVFGPEAVRFEVA